MDKKVHNARSGDLLYLFKDLGFCVLAHFSWLYKLNRFT